MTDGKNNNGVGWSQGKRVKYWLQILAVATTIGATGIGAVLATGKWFYTRASIDDVTTAVSTITKELGTKIESKEDKEHAKEEVIRLDKKVDRQQTIMLNVLANLNRLVGAEGMRPKPLPASLIKELEEEEDGRGN